jgi:hypothetical protein
LLNCSGDGEISPRNFEFALVRPCTASFISNKIPSLWLEIPTKHSYAWRLRQILQYNYKNSLLYLFPVLLRFCLLSTKRTQMNHKICCEDLREDYAGRIKNNSYFSTILKYVVTSKSVTWLLGAHRIKEYYSEILFPLYCCLFDPDVIENVVTTC